MIPNIWQFGLPEDDVLRNFRPKSYLRKLWYNFSQFTEFREWKAFITVRYMDSKQKMPFTDEATQTHTDSTLSPDDLRDRKISCHILHAVNTVM